MMQKFTLSSCGKAIFRQILVREVCQGLFQATFSFAVSVFSLVSQMDHLEGLVP